VVAYALKTTDGSRNTVLYASKEKSCGRRLKPFLLIAASEEKDPETIMINGIRHRIATIPVKVYATILSERISLPCLILLAFVFELIVRIPL